MHCPLENACPFAFALYVVICACQRLNAQQSMAMPTLSDRNRIGIPTSSGASGASDLRNTVTTMSSDALPFVCELGSAITIVRLRSPVPSSVAEISGGSSTCGGRPYATFDVDDDRSHIS